MTTATATSTGLLGASSLTLRKRLLIYAPLTAFALLALWVAEERPYTPGSTLGYSLGLVGACMMLSLFIYPIRKRWKLVQNLGSLRAWFVVHVIFGVGGPILIIFHSTFQTNSFNATVAFWAMVVIAVSGVIGRFVFTHMYQGLEGKKATLKDMEQFLAKCADDAQHALGLVPEVKKELEEYREHVFATRSFTWGKILAFLAIGWKGERLIARARKQVIPALKAEAKRENWPRGRYLAEQKVFYVLIDDYVEAIDMTARYTYWERLLGWWLLAHVPLAYVLLITAIIHVIAVHRY